MKRISKIMHKTVLTLWYQPYTLSVFVGFSLLDKWSAVKKRPNMTCQKLPLAHKAKMPKKEKELLETIHYFDVSHTTFLPNFFQSSTPMWEILKFSVANKTGYIPNIYSKNRKHWKTMWLFNWQYLLQNFDECMYIHIILISHYSLIPPLFYLCKDVLHYHWLLCNYRTYFYI